MHSKVFTQQSHVTCKLLFIALCTWFSAIAVTPHTLYAAEFVTTGKQVTFHYTLTLPDGSIVATTRGGEPLTYIQGTRNIVPGLENGLEGMQIGEKKKLTVSPQEGYGDFEAGKIVEVRKNEVRGTPVVGAFLEGTRPTGEVVRSRVLEIRKDTVVLDFNHPMAGKILTYDIEVVGIQDSPASNL